MQGSERTTICALGSCQLYGIILRNCSSIKNIKVRAPMMAGTPGNGRPTQHGKQQRIFRHRAGIQRIATCIQHRALARSLAIPDQLLAIKSTPRTGNPQGKTDIKCPGNFLVQVEGKSVATSLQVVELSVFGFLAHADCELPIRVWGDATVQLGNNEQSTVRAMAVRGKPSGGKIFYGFTLAEPDLAWRKFVGALNTGITHEDLSNATRFLED